MFKILLIIFCTSSYLYKNDIAEKVDTIKNSCLYEIDWDGEYNIFIEGERLSDGEMSGRDYTFIIKKEKVILKTNSFHEAVFCEGNYKALVKNNQLEIFYAGKNPNFCKQDQANFIIKKEKNKFFINGSDFNSNKWLLLKKK